MVSATLVILGKQHIPHPKLIQVGLSNNMGSAFKDLLFHGSSVRAAIAFEDSRSACCCARRSAYVVFDGEFLSV